MASIYVIQPAFTTGEISPAVGSRVDLDQYKSALLNAENTVIRPYGGCYRRQGSKYIGELKSSTQDAILVSFYNSETDAYLLEVGVQYIRIWKDGAYTGIEISTPYSNPKGLQFSQSGDVMYICSGQYPVKLLRHKQDGWDLIDMKITEPYYDAMLDAVVDNKVTPSGTSGTVTISSQAAIFHSGMEGGYIQLNQKVGSQTLSGSWGEETTTWTSGELYVGEKWKIVTHGTHHYEIRLQKREKKSSIWREYRKYTSNDDQNYTESGSETEGCYLRLIVKVWNDDAASESKLTVDLTRLPYTHTGTAKITAVNSGTTVTAAVKDVFGSTDETADYALSSWNSYYGFPQQSCFFQDRLVFEIGRAHV